MKDQGKLTQVIGWLVQQEEVTGKPQRSREVNTVSLPATQRAYQLRLQLPLDVEGGEVRPNVQLSLANLRVSHNHQPHVQSQ